MQDSLDQVSNWCDINHDYGHQPDQDQVYDNRCHTETPAVTLTARSHPTRVEILSNIGTQSFWYDNRQ